MSPNNSWVWILVFNWWWHSERLHNIFGVASTMIDTDRRLKSYTWARLVCGCCFQVWRCDQALIQTSNAKGRSCSHGHAFPTMQLWSKTNLSLLKLFLLSFFITVIKKSSICCILTCGFRRLYRFRFVLLKLWDHWVLKVRRRPIGRMSAIPDIQDETLTFVKGFTLVSILTQSPDD